MQDVLIIGAGGHGTVVLDILRAGGGHRPIGFLDSKEDLHGREVDGLEVLGPPSAADHPFVVAIGDNLARKRISERLVSAGLEPVTAVHPGATVSPRAAVEPGAVICAGAVVGPNARIGRGAILNTGATVDHHCRVGSYAHVAPGVSAGGYVEIGEGAMAGIGAVLLPYKRIGRWTLVGAGTILTRDVPEFVTVVGRPGRVIRQDGTADRGAV